MTKVPYRGVKLPPICEPWLNDLLIDAPLKAMWIDDTNADVIKIDFDALYHGDFLVEATPPSNSTTTSARSPLIGSRQRRVFCA